VPAVIAVSATFSRRSNFTAPRLKLQQLKIYGASPCVNNHIILFSEGQFFKTFFV
jgi:hypothetical protein